MGISVRVRSRSDKGAGPRWVIACAHFLLFLNGVVRWLMDTIVKTIRCLPVLFGIVDGKPAGRRRRIRGASTPSAIGEVGTRNERVEPTTRRSDRWLKLPRPVTPASWRMASACSPRRLRSCAAFPSPTERAVNHIKRPSQPSSARATARKTPCYAPLIADGASVIPSPPSTDCGVPAPAGQPMR